MDRTPNETSLNTSSEDGEGTYDVADSRWEPEKVALNQELARVVEQGIASMSEKLRSVLLLHDREDISYEEIASMLSLPVGTVKSRLFLARAHLQNVLSTYLHGEV